MAPFHRGNEGGAMTAPSPASALLGELVRIPSVNPDGDSGAGEAHTGEKACAEFVGAYLETLGATVRFEEVLPGRPNVIGTFPTEAAAGAPRLLFAPHTDTVGVAGMTIDPFGGEIRDGRLYGRGASDTKGTMAAMLIAFAELRDAIPKLNATVSFAGLMGEETGQPGSRHFGKSHGGEYDFAIVGEPTSLEIVNTHKGCLWMEIATAGRAAHGATPERGENAVVKMAALLGDLDTAFRKELAVHGDPILGASTINIGTIAGGTRANIVPDACTALLDLRLTPGLSPSEAIGLLKEFLSARDPDIAVKTLLETAPLATDPQNEFVERLASLGAARAGAAWFCDAAVLAEFGIPGVAIGPGSIDQAHTKDEYLALDDLEAGVAFYRKFLESFSS